MLTPVHRNPNRKPRFQDAPAINELVQRAARQIAVRPGRDSAAAR